LKKLFFKYLDGENLSNFIFSRNIYYKKMKKTFAVLLMIAIHEARNKWLASWPDQFEWSTNGTEWSTNGTVLGRRCIRILELAEIDRCSRILELAEPLRSQWRDNYLCWKGDEDLGFKWSSDGRIDGMRCTQTSVKGDN